MEIERVLVSVLEYFNGFSNGSFESKPRYGLMERSEPRFFVTKDSHQKHFKNRLQIFLLKSFKFLSETSKTYDIDNIFVVSIGKEIQYYKEKKFFNDIYESLEEFVGIFDDYLVNIVNLFYDNLKDNKKKNFIEIDDSKIFDKISKIYSFNYTKTYDKYYKNSTWENLRHTIRSEYLRTNEVEFIHGSIVENWNDNIFENLSKNLEKLKIVLGVDDIDKSLKTHKLFQFTKYFQKLHKQTDYLFLKDFQKTNNTKSYTKYIFYFWGHSLDYSDRQYIREVFDLVENSEGSKIKIFYHSISAKGDQLKNLLGIIKKEKIERFMKFNILEFIESTPENLFKEL